MPTSKSPPLLSTCVAGVSVALFCGYAPAAITSSGDVSPNPATIANTDYLTVGNTAFGQMTIDGGSTLQTFAGNIAEYAGSTGDVTVTGAGSLWHTANNIFLGFGHATLTINSGGLVDAGNQTYIVSGNGSTIQFNGGTLTTKNLVAEKTDLQGAGTINTEGWILEQSYAVNSISDLPGQVILNQQAGQNITVNINWAGGNGTLGVDTANLAFANGVHLNVREGYIGYRTGTNGSISATGAGTQLLFGDGDADLFVGNKGNGSLTIADGALVSNYDTYLGHDPATIGTASVHGAGAKWNTSAIYVGYDGQGTISISAGGTVHTRYNSYIGYDPGSSGSVTVDGPGSTWTDDNGLLVGFDDNGSLTITNGGKVSNTYSVVGYDNNRIGTVTVDGPGSTWTNTSDITIGDAGRGILNITAGGTVSSVGGSISYNNAPDTGSAVTVDGAGSTWNVSDYRLEITGAGTRLNIRNGGLVNATTDVQVNLDAAGSAIQFNSGTLNAYSVLAAEADLKGTGTINAKGWVLNQNFTINSPADLPTQFRLNQQPGQDITVNLDWNGQGIFGANNATITLAQGMQLQSAKGYVAAQPGAVGNLTVQGPATKWQIANDLYVGYGGQGTLNITGGANVVANFATFATGVSNGTGGTAFININGPGSTLNVTGIDTGRANGGQARLNITNGAKLITEASYLSYYTTTTTTVNLGGAGSSWTGHYLAIGSGGQANVNLSNGAALSAVADSISIGVYGQGTLNVTTGATVTSEFGTIAENSNSFGLVTLDGPGSSWQIAQSLFIGKSGQATLNIRNGAVITSGPAYLSSWFNSSAIVTVDGQGSRWSLTGGLRTGEFGPATLHIANGGLVTIGGDFTPLTRSTLAFTLSSTSDPFLDVIGVARLFGALAVDFAPGFLPQAGDRFKILDVGGRIGTFDALPEGALVGKFAGIRLNITYNGGDFNDVVLIASGLAGDYNSDGRVDSADYILWRKTDGTPTGFNAWRTHFGQTATGAISPSAAIPEPATAMLLLAALATFSLVANEHKRLDITDDKLHRSTPPQGFAILDVYSPDGIPIPGCDFKFGGRRAAPELSSSQNGHMDFVGQPGLHDVTISYAGFKPLPIKLDLKPVDKTGRPVGDVQTRVTLQPTEEQ